MKLSLPKDDRQLIVALLVVYLLIRIVTISILPLVRDEALYSVMIEEQRQAPTLVPTFLGYFVDWKPPVFFWVYSFFPKLDFLPLEVSYRLPSFLFGFLTIPFLYFLLKNLKLSQSASFFSVLIFTVSFLSIYAQTAVLTDSLNFFLIVLSLYLYTEEKFGSWRFILAGFLSFTAFFVKLVIAFMVPLIVLIYFYFQNKKLLFNKLFLFSLLSVPLAFLLNFYLLELTASDFGNKSFFANVVIHILTPGNLGGQFSTLLGSVSILLAGAGIWFVFSVFGFLKYWKENPAMSLWYSFTILPLISGSLMPWYYLPVLPAISYFAISLLLKWEGKEKPDLFFFAVFSLCLLATIGFLPLIYDTIYADFISEKEVGLLLVNKSNVLIIGDYAPGIAAYKLLNDGLDFGWIVNTNKSQNEFWISEYVSNYSSNKYPTTNGSFNDIFNYLPSSTPTFRKDSNLSVFDYVALVGNYSLNTTGYLIYNSSTIKVYQVN
ncbi:glycosyltransferase family 39 protein [Candidatus Micrarchaeota archaeon]|nr:glycosyltransferase family 39 protein [Candidatus Micrarchaeota archaeon]